MKTLILLLPALMFAACSQTHTMMYVYPEANQLDFIWESDTDETYSLMQNDDGDFTLHRPKTGEFYYYRRDPEGKITGRPSFADDLRYDADSETFHWGSEVLTASDIHVERIYYQHNDIRFHGILTVPKRAKPVPLIVNAHGSERSAATTFDWTPSWYAQAGFATFIFDKRGTGQSGGQYTHNFEILAGDLTAAIDAVKQRDTLDSGLIGVGGFSQGVYVATLAALHDSDIGFVIASYGMTESPIMEDYYETRQHFTEHYPDLEWSDFEPFVRDCEAAFALNENGRWDQVKSGRRYWQDRVDPKVFAGTLVGDGCLLYPGWLLRLLGRSQFPTGLDWNYDPIVAMESLDIPVLWQFAEDDHEAPSTTSISQVQQWQIEGKPFDLYAYPNADHGIYLRAETENGEMYHYKEPDYIQRIISWLRERH